MRKAILLAMAAAIVAMFAIPGPASAAWTKHHVNATESFELELSGTDVYYEGSWGGVTCSQMTSKVFFEAGTTTGTVNTFEPVPSVTAQCQGTGTIAQCDLHEIKADNLPWTIHTATSDTVTITAGTVTTTMTGVFCAHTLNLTPGTMTLTVAAGQTNTTSTATLSGALVQDGELGTSNVTINGTFHVLGTITYGI